MLGALLLAALTQCAGDANGQSAGTNAGISVTPPVVVPPAVVQDIYIYYPAYSTYYHSNAHQYVFVQDGIWVASAKPYGIAVNVLTESPSVKMDFNDSPEKHHAEILHRYPKDWKSLSDRHDKDGDRKAGAHDDENRTPGHVGPPNN